MSQVPDVAPQQGAVPANLGDYQFANTGLEDFSVTDAVLPRIKIIQKEGLWEDTNSSLRMQTLRFIPLGLVKQRVLFHHNVEDDDVPMCKSSDFQVGFPNPAAPANKSFPWQLSGFDPNDFQPDANGDRRLPCDGCQLKEWGSNPTSEAPYCAEQWTIPIYYDASQDMSGEWTPAILTLQKSNVKPIRSYLTQFAQGGRPPFLNIARGTLQVRTRGSVEYSVASFVKESESPRDRWNEFAEQYGEMRQFLTRPPISDNDADAPAAAPAQDNAWGQQPPAQQAPPQQVQQDPWAAQTAPQQAPPVQQPPAQQAPPQDPWAVPQQPQQAPPVQQQPVPVEQPPVQQPPQQVPAPPVQQPPVQTPPQAAPEPPVQQPPVQQPPAAQAPPQQAPAPAAPPAPAGQELPF